MRTIVLVRLRKWLQGGLKATSFGRIVYPVVQKCWRAYAIPRRRRLLQKHGADVLKRLHAVLTAASIPYYCEAGTLLGLIRDNGFIPHDDDIDISIFPDTASPSQVLGTLLEAGYSFLHAFEYEGRITEFTVMDRSGLSVDVFFHSNAKNEAHLLAWQPFWQPDIEYPTEAANSIVEFEFVKPIKLVPYEVLGVTTIVPENYEDVLTSSYGPWKIPDAKYDTVNDRIHRRLDGFAYRVSAERVLGDSVR